MISVLYVDDESALLEATKNFMERGGEFTVDTAISAREAIEKLKAEQYDALVADYLMPEMDGLELLKYLRPRCNGMPFILFTGNGGEEVAIEALNSGADFYVQKKGSPRTQVAELETKIRSAVARRQSDRALHTAERELRTLVEHLTEVIFTLDEEGIITYISPAITGFGYDPKELTGKDFAILVCAEDIPSVARHFAAMKQGMPASFEFRMPDAHGQLHIVRASYSPRVENGRFLGGQGLLADRSEEKKESDQVRRLTVQHQLLLDLSFDGMLIIDPGTGKPVECNDEACRQVGYTCEEFPGLGLQDWEVPDEPHTIRETIPEILQEGKKTFGTTYRTKDGRIREAVVTARVIDDGTSQKIGLVIHDVTKEHEQKGILEGQLTVSEDLFEQAPLAELILAPEGTVIRINRAGAELLRCAADEITGKSLADFISTNDRARFTQALDELVRTGRIHAAPFSLGPEGNRTISMGGSTLQAPEGNIHQMVVTLTDITEQVKKTADLETAALTMGGVIAGARDGIFVCTPDQTITGWNPAMEDITGIADRDALGKHLAGMLPFLQETGADSPAARAVTGEIVATPDTRYEYPGSGKGGWTRSIFSPLRDSTGKVIGIIGVVQEITSRTKTLLRIKAANRIYTLSAHVGARAPTVRDLETLLSETCRVAVDGDTIRMAWIGLFDHAAGTLRPVAHARTGEGLTNEGSPEINADQEYSLAADILRTGAPAVCSDVKTDSAAQPWGEAALSEGYRSLAAVPFRLKGEIVGIITLCSGEPYAFSTEDADVLAYLGTTVSFALDLLDKKTLQRRAGRGGHGSWERTRFLAGGIESAALPFAAVHADGSTGAVNAALCTLLGYTEDELLALALSQLLGPSSDDTNRFLQVLACKKPEHYETTIRKKDGTCIPVELFLQEMPDETDGRTCIGVFITDGTERKRLTDSLETDRQKYRTFFEKMSTAVIITVPAGDILAANPAACQLFGRTEEALRSTGGSGLAGAGDPRFVELVRTCEEKGCAKGELRLIKGDGTSFDAGVEGARFQDQEGRQALCLILRDITEAKQLAGTRVQKQDLTIAILDGLSHPVRQSGAGGESRFFNKAWLAFTGRSPEQEEGNGWLEGIHPDDRDHYQTSVRKHAENGETWESAYRLRHSSGEYRWIREVCVPDSTGACFTCSCYDIQASRQAEAACEEERARYRAVFENMTDAALLISDRILDCNTAATRLFACSCEDLIGHVLPDYAPKDQPDGQPSAEIAQKYLETARNGTTQVFPWIGTRCDGAALETRISLTRLDSRGEQYVLAVITNLTDQNRAEREIRKLASYPDMNPNPVVEAKPDRTITYANPATTTVLSGLGLAEDPAAFLPADFDEIVTASDTKKPIVAARVVHLNERSFQEAICASPEYDLIRIYAYDITDRVQAMEAFAYANHKLGILTSITRHDIQNKLTGVMGYLDLMRGSLRDPHLIEYLDKAETAAEAIRHHIEFTKDYESLGGTAPVWQAISPVLAEIRSHFDLGTIVFEEPSPGFSVFADPMFCKVLYNLVDNSLRHGVHVRRIRIYPAPSETGCILTYEDDGVGISQDKKELIFERGYTTSVGPGKTSGLGLFLVRDILAITGIRIKETGVPGAGSRFEMSIPQGKWRNGPAD